MRLSLILVLAFAVSAQAMAEGSSDPLTLSRTMVSGGLTRSFLLHVPASYQAGRPAPLLLVLHGAGGSGRSMEDVTGFSAIAEQAGFVVAYPDAIANSWFAPFVPGQPVVVTDHNLAFLADLVAALRGECTIDDRRIFSTGLSQGAGMSYLLGAAYPDLIASIAPVAGGVPRGMDLAGVMPARAMSVLMINGTDDQLVKYDSGFSVITHLDAMPTLDLMRSYAEHDGCFPLAAIRDLPDWCGWDGCHPRLTQRFWGAQGTEVLLYTIVGGGHTWPGSRAWLPAFLFGNTSYDFGASRTIWEFFVSHPKPLGSAN